jgi:hypothetical protein
METNIGADLNKATDRLKPPFKQSLKIAWRNSRLSMGKYCKTNFPRIISPQDSDNHGGTLKSVEASQAHDMIGVPLPSRLRVRWHQRDPLRHQGCNEA